LRILQLRLDSPGRRSRMAIRATGSTPFASWVTRGSEYRMDTHGRVG
jgi:hypothetical protein